MVPPRQTLSETSGDISGTGPWLVSHLEATCVAPIVLKGPAQGAGPEAAAEIASMVHTRVLASFCQSGA